MPLRVKNQGEIHPRHTPQCEDTRVRSMVADARHSSRDLTTRAKKRAVKKFRTSEGPRLTLLAPISLALM